MNRKEFGRLVALLRADLGWTQSQLAEYAEIETNTLSNIERGAKKYLEPAVLYRLANALQLTSLERREFFLASCGLDQKQMVRQPDAYISTEAFGGEKVLNDAIAVMSKMFAPAHLGDAYGDVLAVNHILLELMQISPSALQKASDSPVGINNMHMIYGMIEIYQATGDKFNGTALSSIRAFREGSLRYRTKPRYLRLMKEFKNVNKYPLFDRYWRKASVLDDDKEAMLSPFEIDHGLYGNLQIISSSSVFLTPYGELYLSHYFPMDRHTASAFIEIAEKVGTGVVRLMPWPKKDGKS
jgi:transcriptional regulator with XRE-family HTH domain